MGSTFTEFRSNGFWARDSAVEVRLYLLAREVQKMKDAPHWLVDAGMEWNEVARRGGSGGAFAHLDTYATTVERIEIIIDISGRALTWLESQGKELTAGLLNSFDTGGSGEFTDAVPTQLFTQIGRAFIKLLRGEILWSASNSPMLGSTFFKGEI